MSQPSQSTSTALSQFAWLQSPTGAKLLAEIAIAKPTTASEIAVASRLRRDYPAEMVSAALTLHALRQKAVGRFPQAESLWFTRAGLEQASSQAITHYRASRFAEAMEVFDLCCGIGGDLLGLLGVLENVVVTAVDIDPLHLAMAQANAEVMGYASRSSFVESDVRTVELPVEAAVFIDPARRTSRGRMHTGESEPPLDWCFDLADLDRSVGIKAAPGIDHDLLPPGWEFETIALSSDLKEAALWSPSLALATRSATVIIGDRAHHLRPLPGDRLPIRAPEPGDTLIDPNPAVTRAGLVEDLARSLPGEMAMIDEQIGFLLAVGPVVTPFGRALRVVDALPWHEKRLKSRLRELDGGSVDIRRRGLAGDVEAITRRLRGTGGQPFTIAMTRLQNQPWAIICIDQTIDEKQAP